METKISNSNQVTPQNVHETREEFSFRAKAWGIFIAAILIAVNIYAAALTGVSLEIVWLPPS